MKKLILLNAILSTTYCYPMKRQCPDANPNTKRLKISVHYYIKLGFISEKPIVKSISPSLPELPHDMINLIVDMAIYNPTTKKPREAAKTVRALAVTTQSLNKKINNPDFTDRIINHYSSHFLCSHESIAKFLATQQALNRLTVQHNLKKLCTNSYGITKRALDALLQENNINLDFTYNDKSGLQKTPLMLSMNYNSWIFQLLLGYGVNINARNAHGMTVLHVAAHYPINPYAVLLLMNRPELVVDQKNNRGETALLHSLKDRKTANITVAFVQLIDDLLTKANPETIDKQGNSPFTVAKELKNQRIIELISQAIERKHPLHEISQG